MGLGGMGLGGMGGGLGRPSMNLEELQQQQYIKLVSLADDHLFRLLPASH